MQIGTLAIVGVGLIGGSIGLAAKERNAARRVLGVSRRQETLEEAKRLGIVDDGFVELADAAAQADFMVFCAPVQLIAAQIEQAARHCRAVTVLTDAGSTKHEIQTRLEGRLPQTVRYIGSHPLAGSEKRGPEHASADLFEDRLTIVTPDARTEPEALHRVRSFWEALGSRTRIMSALEHDRALALTSHAPHLLASALAGALPEPLFELTATGFRDATRVAAGDPGLWTGIFLQNQREVLAALDRFGQRLAEFRAALEARDESALNQLLQQAKRVRDALGG